jgi:hypothetical protein
MKLRKMFHISKVLKLNPHKKAKNYFERPFGVRFATKSVLRIIAELIKLLQGNKSLQFNKNT